MPSSMQTIQIIGAATLLVGILWGIGWLIARSFAKKLFAAPGLLAQQMDLKQVVERQGRKRGDWFAGEVQGRPFALTYITQKGITNSVNGDSRSKAMPHLRLVLGIQREFNETIYLHRHAMTTWKITDFESVFRSKKQGIDRLNQQEKEALTQFAVLYGNLSIRTRSEMPEPFLPGDLFPETPLILSHDFAGLSHSPEHVQERLNDLSHVASALEAPVSS